MAETARLLIDLDILLYRALWGAKDEDYYTQVSTCEQMVQRIEEELNSEEATLVLSGSSNFRYALYPEYKANRKDQPKPEHLKEAKLYFRENWDAVISDNCEADDVIGLAHDEDSIVVSSDKDFYQLGGLIYNPVKKDLVDIKNPWYFFYLQMLTGDAADNIPGLPNPEKAHHRIPPQFTEATAKEVLCDKSKDEMREYVKSLYKSQYGDLNQFELNAQLLFLKRSFADSYHQTF